ncbi:MAG TPA: hypothetical protein VJ227_00110 [Patescibacteria group bacterium]|nr:hypothetical protein [Patescibacteria group bacterium]
MGFKEGFIEGEKIAQRIYDISSEFIAPDSPGIEERLIQCGLPQSRIAKLHLRLSANPEDYGNMAACIKFLLSHGTLWNWRGERRK